MTVGNFYTLHVLLQDSETGLTAENGIHFEQTAALIFDSEGEDLVQMYEDLLEAAHRACFHGQYHIDAYRVTEEPSGLTIYEAAGNGNNGVQTGDLLPRSDAGVLSFRSAIPGRSGKGRLFMGPVGESANTSAGVPSGSYKDDMTAFGQALKDAVSSVLYAGWRWSVYSQKNEVGSAVTSWIARPGWGSQRGRKT